MTRAADAAARTALGVWLPHRTPTLEPLGDGHINDTWQVRTGGARYVLQRISAAVFPDPASVADKVARVVAHLKRGGRIKTPGLVPGAHGAAWHENADGVWRLWHYVDGTRTFSRLESAPQAEAAGRAFGTLQCALADLARPVADPIPHFMQLRHYLAELDAALAAAPAGPDAALLVDAIATRRGLAGAFEERDRVVHGDCKVNNLLFAADGPSDGAEVRCIIDLDTVMLGHWAWDFGDLVRSGAADADGFSVPRYAALVRGFLDSGAVARDVDALLLAPRYVALMLTVRFLTDHLRGDRYFKVAVRGDNLQRARGQFALLRDMEAREAEMRAAV